MGRILHPKFPNLVQRRRRQDVCNRVLGYRQAQVLQKVKAYLEEHGRPPSYRELCGDLGIATLGEMSDIVASLERRGQLKREGGGLERRIRLA